ncbi:MAG: hypothetical protein JWL81_2348 [Verrucomicrobiales bacterium]|nr:hypothetical protein [Verrucomicrobiales bacterium]
MSRPPDVPDGGTMFSSKHDTGNGLVKAPDRDPHAQLLISA